MNIRSSIVSALWLSLTIAVFAQSERASERTNPTDSPIDSQSAQEERRRPLYLQPVDFTKEDLGIGEKAKRIAHPENSADRHFEKGMLYKQAGNVSFNHGELKRAYRFYEKAEAELLKAKNKFGGESKTLAEAQAVYNLGLVRERIENDRSVSADCCYEAHLLDPQLDGAKRKLVRTKAGRAKIGSQAARAYRNDRLARAKGSGKRQLEGAEK